MVQTRLMEIAVACAFALALLASRPTAAGGFSPAVGDICRAEARAAEKSLQLPKMILSAISLAESGRWHKTEKDSFPWPWTVTSGPKSYYFADKQSAVATVRRMQRDGIRNIDVGCMQINLHYHPEAFASLEDAFDPTANATYAADFLKRLFKDSRSWHRAIGRCHSSTPERAAGYRDKVNDLWREERIRAATLRREAVKTAYRERQAAQRVAREANDS